ncbi:MAG: sulfatase/phosphatase domain-containing protein, partial [Planctomycetota bacterium]
QVSDLLCYQADVLPTLAELSGASVPKEVDGLSILPTILGEKAVGREQEQHEHLYWEHQKQVAVRIGDWKGIQPKKGGDWELYDLSTDLSESKDLADEQPDLVKKMKEIAKESHTPLRPGQYKDRTLHERDRAAKYGNTKK